MQPDHDQDTTIVWRLPKAQKGRYVAASRKAGQTLISWLEGLADAASDPIGDDQGPDRGGRMVQPARTNLDPGGDRAPGHGA
jgi:hypothetical protein